LVERDIASGSINAGIEGVFISKNQSNNHEKRHKTGNGQQYNGFDDILSIGAKVPKSGGNYPDPILG
jgi:hypothetical protein